VCGSVNGSEHGLTLAPTSRITRFFPLRCRTCQTDAFRAAKSHFATDTLAIVSISGLPARRLNASARILATFDCPAVLPTPEPTAPAPVLPSGEGQFDRSTQSGQALPAVLQRCGSVSWERWWLSSRAVWVATVCSRAVERAHRVLSLLQVAMAWVAFGTLRSRPRSDSAGRRAEGPRSHHGPPGVA
jgi:hypothetical protein